MELTVKHDLFVQKEYQDRLERGLTDPARLEALYGSNFWQAPRLEQLREFCKMAKQMLHADEAHITLVTDNIQRIVASTEGAETEGHELDWSICQYMVATEETLSIESATEMLKVCDIKSVADGKIRAYLGVPLFTTERHIIGGFCVAQHHERVWTQVDIMFLTSLAKALTTIHELQAS